ncbi:hypothetical protein F5Y16DRAFT_372688 [Xylariaceae sp. FL0255]|nr:hypothetical protein F5Y16DRAFT_372688 [Xylariaceae sp. FL0255]
MLDFFSSKKGKKQRDDKADKQKADKEKENAVKAIKKEEEASAPTSSSTPIIVSKPDDTKTKLDESSPENTPLLDADDEKFLERLTSPDLSLEGDEDAEGPPPPLPPRVKTPVFELEDSDDAASTVSKGDTDAKGKGKGKEKEKEKGKDKKEENNKSKRFSFVTTLSRNITKRSGNVKANKAGLKPDPDHLAVPSSSSEAKHEKDEMARVLDDLDLAAQNNRAFSLSSESAAMVKNFTQVLKDLVNGVPTAYGDLVKLLEDRDGILARNYEKLPKGLKKLVAQLPEKLTGSLAPELLVAAAEAQGLASVEAEGAGLKGAAKKYLTPGNLKELVTKPGAVVGLLKGIVNALKTRFPAFVGTNVLWSLAVFLLLSALWYCHKRGREVRLEREATEAGKAKGGEGEKEKEDGDEMIDGKPRVEELPDDPQLPSATAPEPSAKEEGEVTSSATKVETAK